MLYAAANGRHREETRREKVDIEPKMEAAAGWVHPDLLKGMITMNAVGGGKGRINFSAGWPHSRTRIWETLKED